MSQQSDHGVSGPRVPGHASRTKLLSKSQDGDEGFVDAPLLFRSDVTDEITEPACVDGSRLFSEYSGGRPEQINLEHLAPVVVAGL
jgi:hypothetical protein